MFRRRLKWIAALIAGAGLAGIVALWLEHRLPLELPVPTGPFPIGRTSHEWDGDLTAWMWYPAETVAPADDYLPVAIREHWERARPGFINFLTRDLSHVRAHSARDVAWAVRQRPHPVVVLRGGGAGAALSYSSLAEDLASHGYVVVGLDITTTENPEGCAGRPDEDDCAAEIMRPMIDGIGRALNHLQELSAKDTRFEGMLDLTRLGLVGHSFGGAQAAEFCSQDARCTAGINIDGRPFGRVVGTGIRVPFMFLLSDHGTPDDAVSRRILAQIQGIYDRQPADTRLRAAISGADHFTFSDDGALLKSRLFRGALRLFGTLDIDGRRQLQVTSYALRTFLATHLQHSTSGPVTLTSREFPEIILLP